jgi:hypothetical protein
MQISDDRLQKALTFLAETDEPCALLKANAERYEFKAEAIRDAIFLRTDGTVAERTAAAKASTEYAEAKEAQFVVLGQYEAMRNKRATEAIVVDTWRTIQANMRKGNV